MIEGANGMCEFGSEYMSEQMAKLCLVVTKWCGVVVVVVVLISHFVIKQVRKDMVSNALSKYI